VAGLGLGALLPLAAAADPGGGGSTDALLALWGAIERAGVPFLLFLAVVGLFTGQVASRRQTDALLKLQQDRYEENDRRWEERWREQRERADRLEQLLFQQSALSTRVSALAERAVEHSRTPTGQP
jgi:hypothetical protein